VSAVRLEIEWTRRRVRRAAVRAVLLLVGCTVACEHGEPNTDLGQDWMDALNSHDPVRIVELLHPTASCKDPLAPESLDPTAYARRLSGEWTVWKDRVYMTKRILAGSNTLVIEWRIQQTHPTGTSVHLDGATILDVHAGRISGVRDYYNTSAYLQFVKAG